MSMDYNDVYEFGVVSTCCGASVFLSGICAECKDHCDTETKEEDKE